MMKNRIIRLAMVSGMLALGTGMVAAQTTNVFLKTYFVLSGFMQAANSQAVAVRIIDKDILAALNAATNFNFNSSAQLLLKSNDSQPPTFFVRQTNGTQVITTDVSNYLKVAQTADVNSRQNLVSYAIRVFTFDDHRGNSFTLTGFATIYRSKTTVMGIGPLTRTFNAGSQAVGQGTVNGAEAVFQGPIFAGFPIVELSF